jgi:hypothetical protein
MSEPSKEKVQALIDDIEKSIASFDERFSKIPLDDGPIPQTTSGSRKKKTFPEIDLNAQRDITPLHTEESPQKSAEAPLTPLLSELAASAKREAGHVHIEQERRRQAALRIGQALRLASDYLDQMTQHLNLLKPDVPLNYAVDRQHQFSAIHWQDSSTRSETRSQSERSLIEKLMLRIRLTCEPLSLLVPDHHMRRVENELYLMNLAWRDAGIVDDPDRGTGHRIEIDGSIPLQLVFTADVDQERIILRCRNLLGLGLSAYTIDPAAIDAAAMDALGRCLLGRSKRLPDAFTPIAFNTPDSTA